MRLIHLRERLRYRTLLRREEHRHRHLFAVVFGDGGSRGSDVSCLSSSFGWPIVVRQIRSYPEQPRSGVCTAEVIGAPLAKGRGKSLAHQILRVLSADPLHEVAVNGSCMTLKEGGERLRVQQRGLNMFRVRSHSRISVAH